MSLEQQVAALVTASNNLTGEVAGKQAAIDARVAAKIAEMDGWKGGLLGELPLGANLVNNALMTGFDTTTLVPTGYSASGCTIQVAHPFTKGFEGPSMAAAPAGAVSDPNLATEANPYWYGEHYMGPRLGNGGLSGGWSGITNGRILKITAQPDANKNWCSVWLPRLRVAFSDHVRVRLWIKLVKGSKFGIGGDSGLGGIARGLVVTKADTDSAPQGWYYVDANLPVHDGVVMIGNAFVLGFPRDEEIEAYVALPYVAALHSNNGMTE